MKYINDNLPESLILVFGIMLGIIVLPEIINLFIVGGIMNGLFIISPIILAILLIIIQSKILNNN